MLFFEKNQKIGLFLGCFYAFFRVVEAKNTDFKEYYFLCLFAAKFSLRKMGNLPFRSEAKIPERCYFGIVQETQFLL